MKSLPLRTFAFRKPNGQFRNHLGGPAGLQNPSGGPLFPGFHFRHRVHDPNPKFRCRMGWWVGMGRCGGAPPHQDDVVVLRGGHVANLHPDRACGHLRLDVEGQAGVHSPRHSRAAYARVHARRATPVTRATPATQRGTDTIKIPTRHAPFHPGVKCPCVFFS